MPYGTIKIDTITFTDGGVDKSVPVSGLVQNPTFTGNVTVTGTISGNIIQGGTTVSGLTVTGTTANFASGVFTTQISGVTITGTTVSTTTGNFTSLTGTTATITSGIIASGTAALPSLAILSDPNTGIYSPGADQLAVATNGTARLHIASDGKIGVGTTSPLSPLVVSNGSNKNIEFQPGSTCYLLAYDRTASDYLDLDITAENLIFSTNNGTERARITSAGLVGIGTSSPAANFQVNAASDVTIALSNSSSVTSGGRGSISCYNSAVSSVGTIRFAAVTDNVGTEIQFFTRPAAGSHTQTMTLDSAGRLGIGSTTPLSNFVVSNSGAEGIELVVNQPDGANTVRYFNYNRSSATYQNVAYLAASHQWRIQNDEKARIDSSGRLLIGTVTGNANGGILQLSSGITFPATAVAASDPNTLDDYEEGTWTPAYTGFTTNSGTLTAVATYLKIGLTVMYQWQQTGGNISTSAGAFITGLPFGFGAGGLTYGGAAAGDSGTQSSIVSFYQGSVNQFAIFMTAMSSMTGLSWSGITRLTP